MIFKRFAIVILALSCFFSGCASEPAVHEPSFTPPWQIMSTNVDSKVKQKYIQDIEHTLILFHGVILNTKTHHSESRFADLTTEVDKYIHMFAKPILTNTNKDNNIENDAVIAKLYLVVISIYSNIDDEKQATTYLKLFHKRYDPDNNVFDLTLDSMDIGYSTLGEGIKELEEKLYYSVFIVPQ
jgi:hypothetical protein